MPDKPGYYWAKICGEWCVVRIKKRYFEKDNKELNIFTCGSCEEWYEDEIKEWGPRIEQYENKEK